MQKGDPEMGIHEHVSFNEMAQTNEAKCEG